MLALLIAAGCAPRAAVPAPEAPPLLTRAEWGASPPAGPMTEHRPDRITIHHTATRMDPARPAPDKLRALQRFSQQRAPLADGRVKPAWADLPYHYYIAAGGTVAEGRDPRYAGDSNTSYPLEGHLQVVVEGNFEVEQPTPAQLASLDALLAALMRRWGIPADAVAGHNAYAETQCPGDALERALRARMGEFGIGN